MKDILRPMLELFVALPGLLLAYFPVKSYLKQSPRNLAAWLLPLMAGLGVGGGLVCYRLRISTVLSLWVSRCLRLSCIPERSGYPSGNPERSRCRSARYLPA